MRAQSKKLYSAGNLVAVQQNFCQGNEVYGLIRNIISLTIPIVILFCELFDETMKQTSVINGSTNNVRCVELSLKNRTGNGCSTHSKGNQFGLYDFLSFVASQPTCINDIEVCSLKTIMHY